MVVGIDEVGRGALAGPMVVGAVTLPGIKPKALVKALCLGAKLPALRDSKKLTRLQRERAFTWLESRITWSVGVAEAAEIDQLGLTAAARMACEQAFLKLEQQKVDISSIVADAGLRHARESKIPTQWFVKGDEKIIEITLASIMAKVWRDRIMISLDSQYPKYGFSHNVGYGTKFHQTALQTHGALFDHRESFLKGLIISSKRSSEE